MFGAQQLLLCLVDAYDAPRLLATLKGVGCGAERLGRSGPSTQGRIGVLVVASPGEIPLVLAIVRRTCPRQITASRTLAALTVLTNPLGEETGGATVLALPIYNSARWALGELPAAGETTRRWDMLEAGMLEAEAIPPATTRPTKLLVAIVPDRAAERSLQALAKRHVRAMIVGSTGGFFRSGNTTIVADVPAEQAQLAAEAIRAACLAIRDDGTPEQGIAFALDVAWQLQL